MVKVFSDGICIYEANAEKSETIAEFLARSSLSCGLYMPCGGEGRCGKCRVDARGELSETDATEKEFCRDGERLACRTKILGDCEIFLKKNDYTFGKDESTATDICGDAVAIDIGTTTLFCALVDTKSGRILKTDASVNPQSEFGADVISRIHAINKDEANLEKQSELIRSAINASIGRLTYDRDKIEKIIVVGNTVMEYIFCGKNPKALGEYPFTTVDISGEFKASVFKTGCNNASLEVTPFLSAYFGSDALYGAALLLEHDGEMLLDMGTNGEICYRQNGKYYYCSAAAGPAFEGAGLSNGCAAVDGAIYKVSEQSGEIVCRTLGDKSPCGFCGSGVIDALAVMLNRGICTPDGRLVAADEKYTHIIDSRAVFKPIKDSIISINGADIRALQLAKSAICTAVRLCAGDISGVKKLCLSGGFGDKIDIHSALKYGIIPKELEGLTVPCGNSALNGAVRALADENFRKRVDFIRENSIFTDLNEIEEFNELFAEYIGFDDK